MPSADLQELEAKLEHTFRDRGLLVRALTHKSFTSESPAREAHLDNEQLEFFGDAILGKYRTILYVSIIYCFGHLTLAINHTRIGLALGLFLIAIGAGGIKPCVSANVGDQFGASNQHLLPRVQGKVVRTRAERILQQVLPPEQKRAAPGQTIKGSEVPQIWV